MTELRDFAAVAMKLLMSGLIAIAAVEAMPARCERATKSSILRSFTWRSAKVSISRSSEAFEGRTTTKDCRELPIRLHIRD
jgi:hypothetical protein